MALTRCSRLKRAGTVSPAEWPRTTVAIMHASIDEVCHAVAIAALAALAAIAAISAYHSGFHDRRREILRSALVGPGEENGAYTTDGAKNGRKDTLHHTDLN